MRWIQDQSTSTISCYNYHSSNIIGDKMYVFGGIGQNNTPRDNLYEYSLGFNLHNPKILISLFSIKKMESDTIPTKQAWYSLNLIDMTQFFHRSKI